MHLLKKYVEDVLIITNNLPLGSRWKGGRITCEDDDIMMDEEAGRSKQEVTMEVLRQMADTVFKCLRFTAEVAGGPEKPLPCLDTQLWMGKPGRQTPWYQGETPKDQKVPGTCWGGGDNDTILYKFYSKPVTNPLCILRRSGIPEQFKVSTAVAEVLRRWKTSTLGL